MARYVTKIGQGGAAYSDTVATAALGAVGQSIDGASFAIGTLPAQFDLYQGGTYNLAQHVSGGVAPYTFDISSGSLPSGVSLSSVGVLSATAGATLGLSGAIVFRVTDSVGMTAYTDTVTVGTASMTGQTIGEPSPIAIPFGLTSVVGGSNLPFTFGHVFKEGDIPTGQFIDSSLADWQARPTSYWPDGSVRHAIISGRATLAANVKTSITISRAGSDRPGAALTQADLTAALPTTTLVCGAQTITLNTLVGTGALHRTVCTGPVMSNFLYRQPLTGSNHLVAWFDVRVYKGGAVEIFPWIENGYLLVSGPTNDVRTYTLTINGAQKFSASVDVKHHTRPVLINNVASGFKHWSYWSGTDPQIEPEHDVAYNDSTKMFPHYGFTPNADYLAGGGANSTLPYTQTYSPGYIGDTVASMGSAGFQPHIGVLPSWAACWVKTSDPRAYRAVMSNALGSGNWSAHYRDENTNEPVRWSTYPNISQAWSGTPTMPAESGGTNSSSVIDRAHQPSMAYVPWLMTGRWYFLDEQVFWTNWSHIIQNNYVTREGAKGLVLEGQSRGRGWTLRTLAHTVAILPTTHPCYSDLLYAWEQNCLAYEGEYITGTRSSGGYVNTLGWAGTYSANDNSPYFPGNTSGRWWDAHWMQMTFSLAFGTAWNLNIAQSAPSKTALQAVRDHCYKAPVGMTGDGSAGTYNYRRIGVFQVPIGTDDIGLPPNVWYTHGQMYTNSEALGNDGSSPYAALSGGTTMYRSNGITLSEMTNSAFASSWAEISGLCFTYAALAMATEHGASGAAASWARVTGSSSHAFANQGFEKNIIWGLAPR